MKKILTSDRKLTFYYVVKLWKRFRGDGTPPENLGASKEYNADMIPKVLNCDS